MCIVGVLDNVSQIESAGADKGKYRIASPKVFCGAKQHEYANEKTAITDTIDDKCFETGFRCGGLVPPETDEEITAHTNQFPEEVSLKEIGGYHQSKHGAGK